MASIASLDIAVGANSATLKKDLDKANKQTKKFAKQQKKHFDGIGDSVKAAIAAIGAIAAGAQIGEAFNVSAEMKMNADAAGIAFDAYQKLKFGLEQAGISRDAFQAGMMTLNTHMLEAARGTEGSIEALQQVGLTLGDLQKMSGEERFVAVLKGLERIKDKSIRAALAMELLDGEFGGKLIDTKALKSAGETVSLISERGAEAAKTFQKGISTIATSATAGLVNALAPVGAALAPAFTAISKFSVDNPSMAGAIVGIGALGTAFTLLSWPVAAIVGAVGAATLAFGHWDVIGKSVNKFLVDELGVSLADISSYMSGTFAPVLTVVGNLFATTWDVSKKILKVLWDVVTLDFKSAANGMKDAFALVIQFFKDNFGAMFRNIVTNMKAQLTWAFEATATAFANFFKGAVTLALKPLINFYNELSAKVSGLVDLGTLSLPSGLQTNDIPDRPAWTNGPTNIGEVRPGLSDQDIIDAATTAINKATLPGSLAETPTTSVPTIPTTSIGGGGSGASGSSAATAAAAADAAQKTADTFIESIKGSFVTALKTGDWKGFLDSVLDRFTTRWLESFTDGLFDGLFGDFSFDTIFDDFGKNVSDGLSGALGGKNGGMFGDIFGQFGSLIKNGLGSIFNGIGGLFGGGGGLGGLFSGGGGSGLLSSIGGLFMGFSEGGLVPKTPYSKLGVDSVPAMLTPGEVVVPVDEVESFGKGNGAQQVFNITITGDISRQTERKINEMLPEIANGVNAHNKESGIA
jgi:hypothetical protein